MRAFWGAFGGWLVAQLCLFVLLWWMGGQNTFADLLSFSLLLGGCGACFGACVTAGRDVVPAFGCLSYLLGWGMLIAAGYHAVGVLGLPGLLVCVTAIAGVLTGFWLMGDGPLSPVLLLFLLAFCSIYGALALFLPPAIFSLRNLSLTMGLLIVFQVAHLVLARLLRFGRRSKQN